MERQATNWRGSVRQAMSWAARTACAMALPIALAAGSLVGVRGGALLMHRLSETVLTRVFAGFLIIVAITMLIR